MKKLTKDQQEIVREVAKNAWSGSLIRDHEIFNPLDYTPPNLVQEPHIFLMHLMTAPENLCMFCKYVMNVTITPMQAIILQELWKRRFPIVIASRGASKCKVGNTKVVTRKGIKTLEEIISVRTEDEREYYDDLEVLGEDGWQKVEYGFYNGVAPTVRVRSSLGFKIEATTNDKIRVMRNGVIDWVLFEDLVVGDLVLIDTQRVWWDGDNNHYFDAFEDGLNHKLPDYLFTSDKSVCDEFLRGVFSNSPFSIYGNADFLSSIQFLLLRYGILSSIENDCLILLQEIQEDYTTDIITELTRGFKQTYDLYIPSNHSFVCNGFIAHNTFTLALYAWLRMMLLPGRKVIIIGAGFRQAKAMFSYMENIWNKAPVLRDLCSGHGSGPFHANDMWVMKAGESITTALPIGDGCLTYHNMITLGDGFKFIGELFHQDKTNAWDYISNDIWSNKKFRNSDARYYNKIGPTLSLQNNLGMTIECTTNHKIRVIRNTESVWVEASQIKLGDVLPIDRSIRWHAGDFTCSLNQAYALGAMIGDGSWVSYKFGFTTLDKELVSIVEDGVGCLFKQYDKYHYINTKSKYRTQWMNFWGLQPTYTLEKIIPAKMLAAPRELMTECLRGLFDTDGHVFSNLSKNRRSLSICFTNTSKRLVQQIQYILLHYGIISKVTSRQRKQPSNRVYELGIYGVNTILFYNFIGFRLRRKQEILEKAIQCKKRTRPLTDGVPVKNAMLKIIQDCNLDIRRYRVHEVMKKKTLTHNFVMKFLEHVDNLDHVDINKIKNLVDNDIYYSTITQINHGKEMTYDLQVPDGNEYIASGFYVHNSKIRGQRSHDTLCDEMACLSGDTLIQTDKGLMRIDKAIQLDCKLINIYSKFEKPSTKFITPMTDMYKITTKAGYSFKCSSIHQVRTLEGWKLAKNLTNEYLSFSFNDYFPENCVDHHGELLTGNIAYLLGLKMNESTSIPEDILLSPKDVVLDFLRGLFTSSSTISNTGLSENRIGSIWVTNTNEQTLSTLQTILLKFGIISSLNSYFDCYQFYGLCIDGINAKRLNQLLQLNRWLSVRFSDNTIDNYNQVKSVELVGQEQLYDYYMPKTNSFIANGIIQHNSIDPRIFEEVIVGFAAVSSDPYNNMLLKAEERLLAKYGIQKEEDAYHKAMSSNQIIMSGTCSYHFNHFYKYFKKYRDYINSKGNKRKLFEAGAPADDPHFDWKDYGIIRIPYELIAEGVMDDAVISRARATLHNSMYLMEYGACVIPGTQIITNNGAKNIEDIQIGDMVLTHRGRFRRVIKRMYRDINENILQFKSIGYSQTIGITKEHPVYIDNDEFRRADLVDDTFTLANLQELNGQQSILLDNYCSNYSVGEFEGNKYLYPAWNKGAKFGPIKNKYKSCIPQEVKLDYDFGIILGYYAAEGSSGANGKALSFALNATQTEKEIQIANTLEESIVKVFGFVPKRYIKKKNTLEMVINNRLLVEVFHSICPGKADTKMILPEILFSNPDLMRGFIVGYWNGDGTRSDKSSSVCSISASLLIQTKLCLSYFGISSSLRWRKNYGYTTFGNEQFSTKQAYELRILDCKNSNFENLNTHNVGKSELKNAKYDIKEKKLTPYDGFVYNLEVEEDNSYSLINATVHNCFPTDSNGFFKRSLIEQCVDKELKVELTGDPEARYIIGVDPASENDNFAIVMIKVKPGIREVVYLWTTTRGKREEQIKKYGLKREDFYDYATLKIRELMRKFNITAIALDSQGGGRTISERLHNPLTKESDEPLIWEVIDFDKPKDTDGEPGLHIIHLINFADAAWTSSANHGLRADFEFCKIKIPAFDNVEIGKLDLLREIGDAVPTDQDDVESIHYEIEELKDELSSIVQTQTISGRDRWDTPEIKSGDKKVRERKDRYSALLMAAAVARLSDEAKADPVMEVGGWAKDFTKQDNKDEPSYCGKSPYISKLNDLYK